MARRRYRNSDASISLTPMIDVMTVLLAVFMVTTPMMTTGIDLDLPKAGHSTITGNDHAIQISVNAAGQYFLSEMQLSPEEVHELLKPSLEYVNYLNTNTDVLKYHVKCSASDEDGEYVSNVFKTKNDIVYTMMNYSDEFFRTKYFYDFKKQTCHSYLKNLKKGHILINGNYSVLFGNPYEMLLHTIGEFDGDSSLPPG